MATPLRVALIAPLSEPLTSRAISDPAVFAWELVRCLVDHQRANATIELTVIARRESERIAPTITLDPAELGARDHTSAATAEESLLLEFTLRGGLDGYDVIHVVGPYLAPLQLLARTSGVVVQTDWTNGTLPAHELASRMISTPRFGRLRISGPPSTRLDVIRLPVDLAANALRERAGRCVACLPADDAQLRIACAVARALDRPLVTPRDTDPDILLDDAAVLLALGDAPEPIGEVWALRAAARGTLVAGWIGGAVESARWPTHAFAGSLLGDVDGLIAETKQLLAAETRDRAARRAHVLALHAPRSIAARHVEAYRALRTPTARVG